MAKKIRILVFTTAYRPMIGGSELALEEIIRRLPDIFFDIVTPRHSREFKSFEIGSNFCIHRVGPGFEIAKIVFPVFGFLKARQLMRSNNYAAVHAYQASHGGGAAWLVKLFSPRLPFILTMQEGKRLDKQPFILNWLRGLIIKRADVITVISNYLREYVNRTAKNKKIFLIPNGVDLNKFKVPDHKLQITLLQGPNRQTIITVSRLVPKNRIGDLIKAFHILVSRFKLHDARLMIIGDGKQREELFNLVSELGLKDSVEFAGSVPNDKIQEYLSSASIFVRPSLSEGLGSAFLEAMAAGLPVVATPVGGIPDFLKDGETGLFCRVGEPEDIADKIAAILSDDDLRNKLIINGRKLVEEKYSWDKIASEFRNVYGSI
ncbi:MAG TPA: glycosyltransferase family 4 protein [Candidatus Paceibacterota bacterium]|nr:glycosyltransferase family 4 protein [Candidatus Paceibacterota bacterium]